MSYYDSAKTIFDLVEVTLPLTLNTKKKHATSKKKEFTITPSTASK